MNLYQLRYFAELAKNGHFRQTAEKLCIAQPSLSHAISLLERELGVVLFEKKGRRSVLTPEGAQFLEYVERGLGTLDDGVRSMKRISEGDGRIELGFLRALGSGFIPEAARGFLESQGERDVRFGFHTGITFSLLEGLKNETYDMVFCTKIENETDIEFVPVSRQDLVLIVPRNHPLAGRFSVSLEETVPYTQVYFSKASGLRTIIDHLFEKIQAKPQIAYEIDEDIVVAGLVSRGFGIAVVPYLTDLLHMDVTIISISHPYWERNFYMATMKNRHKTPAVKNFYDYILAKCPSAKGEPSDIAREIADGRVV